jgi:hypothetical protein
LAFLHDRLSHVPLPSSHGAPSGTGSSRHVPHACPRAGSSDCDWWHHHTPHGGSAGQSIAPSQYETSVSHVPESRTPSSECTSTTHEHRISNVKTLAFHMSASLLSQNATIGIAVNVVRMFLAL